ncbi:MAG: DUF4065 domain-containing protein [Proteobacteria bacterium]|nr:DUF4065 domain-containing protein [Pseudomonadota bacterium]
MASVFDVAAYILEKRGPMTTWKLQKLVYYCQAWSLIWDDAPLFPETIEAWANGPVVRPLFEAHRGCFSIEEIHGGDPQNLTPDQKETVNAVLDYYGDKPSQYLSDLTHIEAPWCNARRGIPDHERSDAEITLESMAEYYSSLAPEDE